jgi:enterochelin esterase-like enzyme
MREALAARRRPLAGLAGAVLVVAALELSPAWRALQSGIAGLDFDPTRTALIAAWIACFTLALLAGALTGRPWLAVLTATAFLVVTNAIPWAWHAGVAAPVLFGRRLQLDGLALAGQVVAIAAIGFVVAVPGAASGCLIGGTATAWAARVRVLISTWPAPRELDRRLVAGTGLLLGLTASLVLLVLAADPLLRYGPAHGLYLPSVGGAKAPAGRVVTRTFYSTAMAQQRPFAVYLPPGYDPNGSRRYPVVLLLHGDPGSYRDWLGLGIAKIVDAGIATASLPRVILVVPDGNGKVVRASQWANGWDGRDRVEDSVLELVAQVDQDYRTLADRRYRVIAGLSEGGFGAANLAARHPQVFLAAISLSGYFSARGPVFGRDTGYRRANSPDLLVLEAPARRVGYFLVAGEQDVRYRSTAQAFAAELDGLGVRHQLFLLPGGHEGSVWTTGLVMGLEQLKAELETVP